MSAISSFVTDRLCSDIGGKMLRSAIEDVKTSGDTRFPVFSGLGPALPRPGHARWGNPAGAGVPTSEIGLTAVRATADIPARLTGAVTPSDFVLLDERGDDRERTGE
ncbi:hypothetical protein ACLQ2R_30255 [Streptosporangium sp. DT93]|uniref:hypothetical protein n=1 Tax=Streptosporangium sp. DT93 TaxID=3393428 RepID=UPI003CEEA269